jgi:hypothetical protein
MPMGGPPGGGMPGRMGGMPMGGGPAGMMQQQQQHKSVRECISNVHCAARRMRISNAHQQGSTTYGFKQFIKMCVVLSNKPPGGLVPGCNAYPEQ